MKDYLVKFNRDQTVLVSLQTSGLFRFSRSTERSVFHPSPYEKGNSTRPGRIAIFSNKSITIMVGKIKKKDTEQSNYFIMEKKNIHSSLMFKPSTTI